MDTPSQLRLFLVGTAEASRQPGLENGAENVSIRLAVAVDGSSGMLVMEAGKEPGMEDVVPVEGESITPKGGCIGP